MAIETIRSLILGLSRSSRVKLGLLGSAASSLAGFALTLSMAHALSTYQFGMFAIASSIYALLIGVTRAAIVEPLLGVSAGAADIRAAGHRASIVGMLSSVPIIAVGYVLASPYLLITGIAAHGLVLYEFTRTVNLAAQNPRNALMQDLAWCASAVAAALAVATGRLNGQQGYAMWSASGAAIGYLACLFGRYPVIPKWASSNVTTATSLRFGSDFLIGSGSAALTTNILGGLGGVLTVAALRAAGTLFGPITLVITLARTLSISFLKKVHENSPQSELRDGMRVTAILVAAAIGPLIFLAFLPSRVGQMLLGQSWSMAEPLLPLLAIESLLIIVAIVPFAGLRALLAGRATLIVRTGLGVLRLGCVVTAGVLWGATAAALAMSLVAIVGAVAWWRTYAVTVRRSSRYPFKNSLEDVT